MEFTQQQTDQIDRVENAVHELCKVLLNDEKYHWDMNVIGEIADAAASILAKKGWQVYYPAIVYDEDGNESYVADFWPRGGLKE